MDDLTLALAALGGLAILGVLAYNAWQVRRAGPRRAEGGAAHEAREPVLDDPAAPGRPLRVEPSLGDAAPTLDAEPSATATAAAADGGLSAPLEKLPRRLPARLDALIDALVTLHLEHPVTGELVLAHLPPSRRAGAKPFLIEGLSVDSGNWEAPAPGARYGELQAGVQLANRSGALNEIEYSEFIQKVQAFADAVGASAEFPDMLEVVGRARELDAFAGQHDAQLAVLLRARAAAWSVGYIVQQAGLQGFVPGALPGRLVLPGAGEQAPPILVLSYDSKAALAEDPNQAALRELTLAFDVPQTDPEAEPFAAWYARARALAQAMDAVVVDDRGQPLGPPAFAAIDAELKRLYAALAERDLAAGSAAARRVFS
ncbi:cell division protein FtsZ [Piscinibacter sakaiensis]|nr:cell division protein FtsZ [Piscinibacter sakaiensis]